MLEWNVYLEDFNRREIKTYNIFNHHSFCEDCKKNAKKNIHDYKAFCEQLKRDVMYYFWSKCECEIVITDPLASGKYEVKVDVYDQVALNWDVFCAYVWDHGAELRRREKNGKSKP